MGKNKKSSSKKKALQDYKKVKSTFIPPMTHRLGPMKPTSYLRQMLPELIWWDVIAENTSHQFAIDLAADFADFFKDKETKGWWACISEYENLKSEDFKKLKEHLRKKGKLQYLQQAIDDFLQLFPKCPLNELVDYPPTGAIDLNYLAQFEKRMEELEDKRSRAGVLMQAQAIYMGFTLGKLKVFKGLALADFPQVADYPNTERSKQVGASICATINSFGGMMLPEYKNDNWVIYFWERCYEMRPIKMEHLEHE